MKSDYFNTLSFNKFSCVKSLLIKRWWGSRSTVIPSFCQQMTKARLYFTGNLYHLSLHKVQPKLVLQMKCPSVQLLKLVDFQDIYRVIKILQHFKENRIKSLVLESVISKVVNNVDLQSDGYLPCLSKYLLDSEFEKLVISGQRYRKMLYYGNIYNILNVDHWKHRY